MHYPSKHAFEKLGHDSFEYRTGTSSLAQKSYGFEILDLLRRQLRVKEKSQETDVYFVRKEERAGVALAIRAWMDAQRTLCENKWQVGGGE